MAVRCCNNVEIERVQNLSKQTFIENYLETDKPVIIENATKDWAAKQWTLDTLCELVGDNRVNVRSNTNCEEYKLGTKYNIRETSFREYVQDLKADNKRSHNSYLAVQNLKKSLPQLQDHVVVPDYVGKLHGGPFMWIAPKGHYEYCHFDPDHGFLVMIQGMKQVRLFGCCLKEMYPNPLGSKGRTIQSMVNCEDPDLEKQPLFKAVTCHSCLLMPGEMLYIPALWWHQVTSIEVAISVNMFWGDAGTNGFLTRVLATRWDSTRHWILNIVEQNRNYPSFPRTLSRLPEALDNLIQNQWYDKATPEQINLLVEEIKAYLGIDELPNESSGGKHPPPLQIRGLVWRS